MATATKKSDKRSHGKSYSYEEYVKHLRPESVREEEEQEERTQPLQERRRQEFNKLDRQGESSGHC